MSSSMVAAATAATGDKGYFSGLRASKSSGASNSATSELPTRAEMSATVRAAARAAAARLAGDKTAGVSNGAGGVAGASGSMEEGTKRIERDIFAARPSRGQALGVSAGGYDVYPETGDFETYDSDEASQPQLDELMKLSCSLLFFPAPLLWLAFNCPDCSRRLRETLVGV